MNPGPSPLSMDAGSEIANLIEVLHETDRRLEELLAGQVDSVMDGSGQPIMLRKAQWQLGIAKQEREASMLDALPARIALLDSSGVIVSVNSAWSDFALDAGCDAAAHVVGANYLDICAQPGGANASSAVAIAQRVRAVLQDDGMQPALDYMWACEPGARWFSVKVSPLAGTPRGVVVMHIDITARRQVAEGVERLLVQTDRRERMLTTMLSSISDFAYIFDQGGRLLFANEPLLKLWGLTLEEVVGKDYHELGYPLELATHLQAQLAKVLSTGQSVSGEAPYVSPAGDAGYHEYIFSPAFSPDGKVDLVAGSTRDITGRRAAQVALTESAAEFRSLATAVPQIVWAASPRGGVSYFSQRLTEYTGVPVAEALGGAWTGLVHPDDLQAILGTWGQGITGGELHSAEMRVRRHDGVYRWWLVRGSALLDAAGAVQKWIGTCTDIDELKEAQLEVTRSNRELRQQQAEMRVLFNLVPASIVFKDTTNRLLRVNERTATMCGKTVAQMEGQNASDLFPDGAARFVMEDMEVIRTGRPQTGILEQLRDADGNPRWVQSDKVPYLDEHGKVAGIVVMSQDVTQRQLDQESLRDLNADLEGRVRDRTAELDLAREEAERASGAKSEFLATMSHEIRTPMSGLLGMLQLLGLTGLDAQQHSTLAVARQSGNELLRIIDDILDFSKIEANCLELNVEPGSIREVVEAACRLHSQIASSKSLALNARISPLIAHRLAFDGLRLGQVLHNFLNNAIKFTERGGVDVSVDLVGQEGRRQRLRFEVRDTGIGMTDDQLQGLFRPFTQASRQTSARFGGTGLGLVIARRLAELMGGTLDVRSEAGRGTTLTLTAQFDECAPVVEMPAAVDGDRAQLQSIVAGRRAVPSLEQAQADGSLLLVVDDHPTNRRVLLGQVASLGYAAEFAADGAQALAAWKTGRYGAVITDCNMPVMNGYEFAAAVRALEAGQGLRRMPIIGCTANALASAAALCIEAGMDDCLVKPVDLAEMGRRLDRWLPVNGRGQGAPPAAIRSVGAGSAGLIDIVLLGEISGGDALVQAEILREFQRVNDLDAVTLRLCCAELDFAAAMQCAHRIKGSSLMLGATLLAHACAALEVAGSSRQPIDLKTGLGRFETELVRLNLHLNAVLAAAHDPT